MPNIAELLALLSMEEYATFKSIETWNIRSDVAQVAGDSPVLALT